MEALEVAKICLEPEVLLKVKLDVIPGNRILLLFVGVSGPVTPQNLVKSLP